MYGIINKAVQDLVVHKFGEDMWSNVLEDSGLDIEYFISNETYDDSVTYRLMEVIVEKTEIPLPDLLKTLGEWWVIKVSKEKYGSLMESGGATLSEFLTHLPLFHNRVMLIYPKINAPEFRVSDVSENGLNVHYYSNRAGLKDFVVGIFEGLGKMYETPIDIEILSSRDEGSDHEVFKLSW